MALHRYVDFRVEVFYFDSPCRCIAHGYVPCFLVLVQTSKSISVSVAVIYLGL